MTMACFARAASVPGSTTPTLISSAGARMRGPFSAVKRSSNGLSRESRAAAANSPASHRRAAPMPRVSEAVSESVWRVPNETSFATTACNRAGSMR